MGEPAIKLTPPSSNDERKKAETPKSTQKNKITKIHLMAICGVALVLITMLSYQWFIYSKTHIETNNAYVEADIYNVQSRMMGYVKELSVEEGDPVKKNQTLLVLDDTDINVEKAFKEVKLKKANVDFERAVKLVKEKLISQSDFELVEANKIAAETDFKGSELKLQYTHVSAPADGVVAKTSIRSGQFIQPGQNLVTVVSNKSIWIKANYKETQIQKVKPGQKVSIEVDAYPGVEFHGQVAELYPSSGAVLSLLPPENATGNFTKVVQRIPVKISVQQNEAYPLKVGMSVVTTIHTDSDYQP
jgi:membrane fusion protein (multidrug efflux system)